MESICTCNIFILGGYMIKSYESVRGLRYEILENMTEGMHGLYDDA